MKWASSRRLSSRSGQTLSPARIHTYMYLYIYIFIYICIYMYMYIHVYIYIYVYICIYIDMYLNIYRYMHPYIYIYMDRYLEAPPPPRARTDPLRRLQLWSKAKRPRRIESLMMAGAMQDEGISWTKGRNMGLGREGYQMWLAGCSRVNHGWREFWWKKPMLHSRSGILRFKAGLMKTLDNHIGESTPGTLLSKKNGGYNQ